MIVYDLWLRVVDHKIPWSRVACKPLEYSGFLPVNANTEVNIFNLNNLNSFFFIYLPQDCQMIYSVHHN